MLSKESQELKVKIKFLSIKERLKTEAIFILIKRLDRKSLEEILKLLIVEDRNLRSEFVKLLKDDEVKAQINFFNK